MKMSGSLPLESDLTVGELIETLSALPPEATVRGAMTKADRYGTDQYRLEISWNTAPEPVASGTCDFDEAWVGICKQPAVKSVGGKSFCTKHSQEKCYDCKAQATRNCAHTSQFVCGSPMCDKHRHHSDG